jgi:flagellar motor switch protein FliN/FliY
MKFIDVWIREAKAILSRELSATVTIVPASVAPAAPESPVGVGVEIAGGWHGKFRVVVEAAGLAKLLEQVRLTEAGTDAETTAVVWEEVLRQVNEAAANACRERSGQSCAVQASQNAPAGDGTVFCLSAAGLDLDLWILDQVEVPKTQAKVEETPPLESGTRPTPPQERSELVNSGLDLLLDVELEASLRFGSREMTLNELMHLGPGDVVQLDRHISDAVDLIVGDKIVARGDVVLVNGNFGLRVSEIAEPKKSLESIRCLF